MTPGGGDLLPLAFGGGVSMDQLELEIEEWRAFVEKSPAVDGRDVEELEDHLRGQIADLTAAGLSPDEALLVAVKRMGAVDESVPKFAREHSARLWRQLVMSDGRRAGTLRQPLAGGTCVRRRSGHSDPGRTYRRAGFPTEQASWLARNASLFVLPFLAGYFARRRGLALRQYLIVAVPFVIAAVVINAYPFVEGGSTALWWPLICPWCCGSLLPTRT